LGTLESSEVTEQPYPEIGITEETRRMYPDNYSEKYDKVFKEFVNEIMKPMRPIDRLEDHSILLDELTIMYDAHMTIGGEQNRFNASVLRAAINTIISCTK
jgi:hypothetical protein